MGFPPFRVRGRPNLESVFTNAVLINSMYKDDVSAVDQYCRLTDSVVEKRDIDHSRHRPDLLVLRSGRDLLIVLDGTMPMLSLLPQAGSWYSVSLDPHTGTLVHGTYLVWTLAIEEIIGPIIERIRPARVLITGHSMGGAVAWIAACHLTYTGAARDLVHVQTFGAPKSFSGQPLTFAPFLYDRLVNEDDPVFHAPPKFTSGMFVGYVLSFLGTWFRRLRFQWEHQGSAWALDGEGEIREYKPGVLDAIDDELMVISLDRLLTGQLSAHFMDTSYQLNAERLYREAIGA